MELKLPGRAEEILGQGVKGDTGREEQEKGQASDSFKRACFNWGIGRALYTAPFIWIPAPNVQIILNVIPLLHRLHCYPCPFQFCRKSVHLLFSKRRLFCSSRFSRFRRMDKNNGVSYTGLNVKKKDADIGPVFSLDAYFEEYENGYFVIQLLRHLLWILNVIPLLHRLHCVFRRV